MLTQTNVSCALKYVIGYPRFPDANDLMQIPPHPSRSGFNLWILKICNIQTLVSSLGKQKYKSKKNPPSVFNSLSDLIFIVPYLVGR